jgi:uncharacterized membrane protein YeaQ/YmgE (transglycosylase-associated protein family)
MDSWRVFAPGQRWAARPAHTIRVVLRTGAAVAVGYHLHDLALVRTDDEERLVGHLGPDLLGPDWNPGEAVRRLRRRPDVAIGAALVDQRNLAGIGNLQGGNAVPGRSLAVGPGRLGRRPGRTWSPSPSGLMAGNRGRWAQITTGSSRRGEQNYVFERAGRPCRRCGTAIELDVLGDRLTYWCPRCQPPLADRAQQPILADRSRRWSPAAIGSTRLQGNIAYTLSALSTDCPSPRRVRGNDGFGIISAIIIGIIVGILGRLVLPGRQNIGALLTVVVGIVAALVGTWLAQEVGVKTTDGVDWIEIIFRSGWPRWVSPRSPADGRRSRIPIGAASPGRVGPSRASPRRVP